MSYGVFLKMSCNNISNSRLPDSIHFGSSLIWQIMSAVMKKPAGVAPPCTGAFDASGYTKWVKTYDSRQKCLDDLGGIYFCQSHAARSVKKSGNVTFLRFRLRVGFSLFVVCSRA